jgi:hypothetical protein
MKLHTKKVGGCYPHATSFLTGGGYLVSLLLGPCVHDSLGNPVFRHSGRLYLTLSTGYPFCLVQGSMTALTVTLFDIMVVFT